MTVVQETEAQPGTSRISRVRTRYVRAASVVLSLVVVGSTVLFVSRSRGEFHQAIQSIDGADPRWILAALLLQCLLIALIGVKYRLLLRRLGYPLSTTTTTLMQLRRHTIGSILPFGGASSWVTFARDLSRSGVTIEDAVFTAGLATLTSEIAFAAFLVPVLVGLVITGEATGPMLAGSLLMLGLAALLTVVLLMICRLGPDAPLCRRFPRKLVGIVERTRAHGVSVRDLVLPVMLNLGVNAVGVAALFASCAAVGATPSLWAILAGRVIGSVLMLIAPFMQGTGAVELSLTASLREAGMPAAAALAAVLVFRITQFWFPLVVGGLAYVQVDRAAWTMRRRQIGLAAAGAVWIVALVISLLVANPDFDRPSFEDEAGIFWGLLVVLVLACAWFGFVRPAGRVRRAFARQRID
jgi:uncharacterized membrane protein YbhN (UPF0104 family)